MSKVINLMEEESKWHWRLGFGATVFTLLLFVPPVVFTSWYGNIKMQACLKTMTQLACDIQLQPLWREVFTPIQVAWIVFVVAALVVLVIRAYRPTGGGQ